MLSLKMVCSNLEEKADWLVENIRKNEWIQDGDKGWLMDIMIIMEEK